MDKVIERLILDLIDWLIQRERTYEQVICQWHNSHVRLHVWREANRRGLIRTEIVDEQCFVKPTSLGLILGELRRESRRQIRQPRSGANVHVLVDVLTMPSEPPPQREQETHRAVLGQLDVASTCSRDDSILFSGGSQMTRRSEIHRPLPASANSGSEKCAACEA